MDAIVAHPTRQPAGAQPFVPEPAGFFDLLEAHVPVRRHRVRQGAAVYRSGSPLGELHLVRAGVFKVAGIGLLQARLVIVAYLLAGWLTEG